MIDKEIYLISSTKKHYQFAVYYRHID